MLDLSKLQEYLALYKEDFPFRFEEPAHNGERVRWNAVQWFQDNWNLEAEDFAGMLRQALLQTGNLLAADNYYPRRLIWDLADRAPEKVRSMFRALFDGSQPLMERMDAFWDGAEEVLHETSRNASYHYQTLDAVMTYLGLWDPERWYLLTLREADEANQALGGAYGFPEGEPETGLQERQALCEEIRLEILRDEELVTEFRNLADNGCYPDPKLRVLTGDFCAYVATRWRESGIPEERDAPWMQPGYRSGLSAEEWAELVEDRSVVHEGSRKILARFLDLGGEASCTQMREKYGNTIRFYMGGMEKLGRRVAKERGYSAPNPRSGTPDWWQIPFLGRRARPEEKGAFVFRLRPELAEALSRTDLSDVPLVDPPEEPGPLPEPRQPEERFWRLTVNPGVWDFSRLAVGEEIRCSLRMASGRLREDAACFQAARAGDPVLICETGAAGRRITALARIGAEQDGSCLSVEKKEGLPVPLEPEALAGWSEVNSLPLFDRSGTLGSLSREQYDILLDLIREENPAPSPGAGEPYTRKDFFEDVYMDEGTYNRMVWLLEESRNLILQGPPGVGKSYAARRLAWSMLGEKDSERVEMVQFHQSYAYEDFVLGYRPDREGFRLSPGVFFRFCRKAANRPDQKFFFLIDEINRGNLSRIFGELLMLLERDYRKTSVTLAGGISFSVPDNVYIIGMMNTSDRSLALLDYALRRRFRFVDLEPCFDLQSFQTYQLGLESPKLDRLIEQVKALNEEIKADPALGSGCCIGHSYFCGCTACTDEWLQAIVECDLLPVLREYWFDNADQVQKWEGRLRSAIQ